MHASLVELLIDLLDNLKSAFLKVAKRTILVMSMPVKNILPTLSYFKADTLNSLMSFSIDGLNNWRIRYCIWFLAA